ncbi:MAG TPA: MFS transporter, partial [Thermoplasmata archaeon]|nr:MFS transporter [Thermoplasmata archaeon]
STFGITPSEASLILSSYLVVGVALTPVVGKLGDIYGKRLVLGIVLVAYAACVSITGFSPNFPFMIAARAFQGIGLTIIPLGMALVREEFPKSEVPRAQGILAAMFGVGFAVSLPLGAWVSNTYGWRFTYHSAIPAVLLLSILTIVLLRESAYKRPHVKVDFIGAGLLGLSLALFVLGLSEGPTWGWTSGATLGAILLGAAILAPLYFLERRYLARGGEPLLDLRLLGKRNVLVSNVVLGVAGLGMFLALFSLSYRFELPGPASFGESIFFAGLSLVPMALAMLVFAPIAGFTVARTGVKPQALLGGAAGAAGFLGVAFASSLPQIYASEILIGAGLAFLNASVVNFLVLSVEPRDMGLATSMNGVFRNLGSSIGAPIAGSILTTYLVAWSPAPGAPAFMVPGKEAFQLPFLIAAAMMALAAGLSLLGREVLGPRAASATRGTPAAEPVGGPGTVGTPAPSH